MPGHHRDLTDDQWAVLDPLIPERLAVKTAVVAHGDLGGLFSMGFSGYYVPVLLGVTCPSGIHRIRPAIAAFSIGFEQAF